MIAIFAILLACSCLINAVPQFQQVSKLNERIVGGEVTYIEEYPYQASLQYVYKHVCGAVIISENYVVTAAHCTDGVEKIEKFRVRVGTTYLGTGGLTVSVAEIYQNPRFSQWDFDYDISILKLVSSLPFGSAIAPVKLPEYGQNIVVGEFGAVTGWGTQVEGGPTSSQLQVVYVPLVSLEDCKKAYSDKTGITERMVCAGYPEGGKDACQDDSGGPLVVDGVLIGIIAFGCARPDYPRVYSSIPALRDFISEVTGL